MMKDCEKILNELYWRMKVMAEEKENYLGAGYRDTWGRDYGQVLLDFIEFIGISVLWNREIGIVLVGKLWLEFLMCINRESGLRLDSMIFELINVYKGSEEV